MNEKYIWVNTKVKRYFFEKLSFKRFKNYYDQLDKHDKKQMVQVFDKHCQIMIDKWVPYYSEETIENVCWKEIVKLFK